MISLQCTHCQQRLEMDDAFAGGVCRCQFCGTIQTVPKKGKSGTGKSSSSSSKGAPSKALYKKNAPGQAEQSPAAAPGTGLDELAEIVASSGLARGSLRKPPPANKRESTGGGGGGTSAGGDVPAGAPQPRPTPIKPILIGGGAVIVLLLGLVIYFATRTREPTANSNLVGGKGSATTAASGDQQGTSPEVVGPSFAGVSLGEVGDVVYLLDRSQANDTFLDALKAATYKSVLSLGPNRRFQIIFWHRADGGIAAYPDTHSAPATPKEVDAARRRFEDVVAYGTTELKPTIEKAMVSNPATVVIATAKGFGFEESNVAAVAEAVGDADVKVHTVSLGEGDSAVLKRIAEEGHGEYRAVTQRQLREMAN